MAGDLLLLAVQGGGGAVVLRLPLELLQQHHRAVPQVQLRLPLGPVLLAMRQAKTTIFIRQSAFL